MSEVVERILLVGFGLMIFLSVFGTMFLPFFEAIQFDQQIVKEDKYDKFVGQFNSSIYTVKNGAVSSVTLDVSNFVSEASLLFGAIFSPSERFTIVNIKIIPNNPESNKSYSYELKYPFNVEFRVYSKRTFNKIIIEKEQNGDFVKISFSEA